MKFWKYQGAGNDFIMLDQREQQWLSRADTRQIKRLCDRRFGIGADGLILLQNRSGFDFEMVYFNADGRESTMCGNGGRCIAAFAKHLGIVAQHGRFWAIDGEHQVQLSALHGHDGLGDGFWVELQMIDVREVKKQDDAYVLNTGSPHFVRFVESVEPLNVVVEGRAVRYAKPWEREGINVNFVAKKNQNDSNNALQIRTYERGVEDETFACGTGVTAAAIAAYMEYGEHKAGTVELDVEAKGGQLAVRFQANGKGSFADIWLCGPAVQVFEGTIHIH